MKSLYYDFEQMILLLLREYKDATFNQMETFVLSNYNPIDFVNPDHHFIFVDLFDQVCDDLYFKAKEM